MEMPKSDSDTRTLFESLLPDDPRVQKKPMFGHLAGFVNGNMFAGTFGEDLIVKLPPADRDELLSIDGAAPFCPSGRPMGGYVTLPRAWKSQRELAREWIERGYAFVATLPPKVPKPKKPKK
jgi:TfoX/Sxy family transcriptional regulator of competence genes